MLTPFTEQYTNTLDHAARSDAPCSAAAPTGQTGLAGVARRASNERPPGRDLVGAGATWVAIDSAGQLEHAMETRDEQHIRLEKIRAKKK